MSEEIEPDWLAELAKGGDAVCRQIEPIVQAAEQFVRDARRAKASGGSALPLAQRVALAMDAGMRELLPGRKQSVAHQRTAALVVNVSFAATARVISGAGLTIQPVFGVSAGDVASASENPAVQVAPRSRRSLAEISDGQILALVLVWLVAFVLPQIQATLPSDTQALAGNYYATVAIALAVTWRIRDKNG